jgi:diguanylate cyclase (GGDEF)-like protein
MNQYQEKPFSKDFYLFHLVDVFRKSLQVVSFSSLLKDGGWIFVIDQVGDVIASEKIGNPNFDIKISYPLAEEAEYKHDVNVDSRTVCFPILENTWFQGYIGISVPFSISEIQAAAFLQGFIGVFRLTQEQYITNEISSCIKAVNQNLHLDNVMQTIVERMVRSLMLTSCVAVVFDEDQDGLLHLWSSGEAKLFRRQEITLHRSRKIYENIVSHFSEERFILHNENIDIQKLFGLTQHFEERCLLSPFRSNNKIIGFLAVLREAQNPFTPQEQQFVYQFTKNVSLAIYNSTLYMRAQRDEQKQAMLFEITKKFHSSINVDDVLQAVIENTKKLYPDMNVDLWLSHDSSSTTLPVKQFSYSVNGNNVSAQAFMEARTVIVRSDGGRSLTLAAPLRGKQGVYGVLELYSDKFISLPTREIEYITMLADTAGNAFENAQLYEQSRRLIKELLLIDEMTRQLNKNIRLNELLAFITRKLTETFRTEHCCIFSWSDEENSFVLSASTQKDTQEKEQEKEFVLPVEEARKLYELFSKKETIILANQADTTMLLPSFPCTSLMAVPLMEEEEVKGAIVLMDSKPNRYTFDEFKRLEMLARHVKVAVTNASLHAEVERMVVTDNLTGLYNRKFLYDSIRQSQKKDVCGSLILIDIDYFKNVNDTYGHQTGDEILLQVAEQLTSSIRSSDIAARWGGEEMAVYLPKVKKEIAHQIAERLRLSIMHTTQPQVTISSGIASWTKEEGIPEVEYLFQRADEALYQAKRSGRNQVCVAEFV